MINLLKEKEWQKADHETFYIMRKVLNLPPIHDLTEQALEKLEESNQLRISAEGIKEFNCKILLLIDGLWKVHSNHRFGFSVQNEIYSISKDWVEFGKKVGWHINGKWIDNYIEYEDDNKIPRGYYPLDVIGGKNWDESKEWFICLREKLSACKKSYPEFQENTKK